MSDLTAFISNLSSVGKTLQLYVSGVFFTTGIVLNVFAAVIFYSCKSLNRTSMGRLYGALSIADAVSLCCSLFLAQFMPNLNPKLSFSTLSDPTCRLFYFFIRSSAFTASWLQMYISLDRWISIRFPRRFKTLSSPRTINFIVLGIAVAMCAAASENFIYTLTPRTTTTTSFTQTDNGTTVNSTTTTTTSYSCTGSSTFLFVAQIVSAAFRTWIPLTFLVVINIFTIRILVHSRRRVTGSNEKAYSSRERQFTTTVLALNGIFFLLNFPFSVYWVVNSVYNFMPNSSIFSAWLSLASSVTLCMAYLYQALNFYLNLAFNSLFRREIIRLLYRVVNKQMPASTAGQIEATNSIRRVEQLEKKSTVEF